jgi:hypothetical protein
LCGVYLYSMLLRLDRTMSDTYVLQYSIIFIYIYIRGLFKYFFIHLLCQLALPSWLCGVYLYPILLRLDGKMSDTYVLQKLIIVIYICGLFKYFFIHLLFAHYAIS